MTHRFDIFKAKRAAARLFDQGQCAVGGGAEQLCDQLIFGPSRTRKGDNFAPSARTNGVQRMGDQGFTRANFAVDQHMPVGLTPIK